MAFEFVKALRAPTMTFTALLRRRLRAIRHKNLVTMAKRLFVVESFISTSERGVPGHANSVYLTHTKVYMLSSVLRSRITGFIQRASTKYKASVFCSRIIGFI